MAWRIEGQYMESCNCIYVCPCIGSNLTARPSEGDCKAAVALRIDKCEKDGVKLNGLSFIVMLHSPAAMAEGNMTVGLIVDERASEAQVKAITDIATGAAGGPMAALAPLVGKVAGVEKRPIRFEQDGLLHTLAEPNLTAISGETANFLAGGEFPIPVAQQLGTISVEFKKFGIGLAFTPVVMSEGRISLKVSTEVSELSNEGAVVLSNIAIPALTAARLHTRAMMRSSRRACKGVSSSSKFSTSTRRAAAGSLPSSRVGMLRTR